MRKELEVLHNEAVRVAKVFHQAESDLISLLQRIQEKKVFLLLEYSSLFDYATRALKLSEANAYNFITVARKSMEVPELKEAIDEGRISVSKARKITPVVDSENYEHWIGLAETSSKRELEKEVARVRPELQVQEKTRYVSGDRIELKMGVSEELMEKLKRAQDLARQKSKQAAGLEETLAELLDFYLEKNDPVEKAKRNAGKPVPGQGKGRAVPAAAEHEVHLRDQGQCTHVSNGVRCLNRRWLETHHKVHYADGGSHDPENLETLCSAHHRFRHRTT